MDLLLIVLILLLVATLAAFIAGITPYPIGSIILLAFVIARIFHLRTR